MIEAIDQFLLDLYAAPTRRGGWSFALDAIRHALDLESAIIQELAPIQDRFRTLWIARDAHSERQAVRHDALVSDDVNPRLSGAGEPPAAQNDVAILSDEDFGIPKPDLERFQTALVTVGLGDFLCVRLPGPASRGASLILHRRAGDPRGYSSDDRRFLHRIGSHVSQALAVRRGIDDLHSQVADLEGALDQMRFGVVICDADGYLLRANQAAHRIITTSGPLYAKGGRLGACDAASSRALMALIACASHKSSAEHERLLSMTSRGGETLQIFATPLAGDEGRVALVIGGDAQPSAFNVLAFARLFSLSPAEGRIVRALASGATIQSFAEELGLSEGTIRLQLKRALAKTGCARQSELVRLVCASPLWSAIPVA